MPPARPVRWHVMPDITPDGVFAPALQNVPARGRQGGTSAVRAGHAG